MATKLVKKPIKKPARPMLDDEDEDDLVGNNHDEAPASSRKVKRSDNLDGGTEASARLKSFIQRIERLVEDRDSVNEDIKDVYSEAKSTGFDVKVLRAIIQRRKQEPEKVREFEELLDLYLAQLGYE